MTDFSKYSLRSGGTRYITEASELGWAPGHYAVVIEHDGVEWTFEKRIPQLVVGHEDTQGWMYKSAARPTSELIVLND
jgi:hypothetical protein